MDSKSKLVYDHRGVLIETGEDVCDCLKSLCQGCHFPCRSCKSVKCGANCRENRVWFYDKIEIEGLDKKFEILNNIKF